MANGAAGCGSRPGHRPERTRTRRPMAGRPASGGATPRPRRGTRPPSPAAAPGHRPRTGPAYAVRRAEAGAPSPGRFVRGAPQRARPSCCTRGVVPQGRRRGPGHRPLPAPSRAAAAGRATAPCGLARDALGGPPGGRGESGLRTPAGLYAAPRGERAAMLHRGAAPRPRRQPGPPSPGGPRVGRPSGRSGALSPRQACMRGPLASGLRPPAGLYAAPRSERAPPAGLYAAPRSERARPPAPEVRRPGGSRGHRRRAAPPSPPPTTAAPPRALGFSLRTGARSGRAQ